MTRPNSISDALPRASNATRRLNPHLFPAATVGLPNHTDRAAPAAVVERDLRNGSLAKGKIERRNPTRFLVRVVSWRKRLLDEDNLSEKYFVDCCRYAALLPGDDPGQARIITTQEKVGKGQPERTEISIEIIP